MSSPFHRKTIALWSSPNNAEQMSYSILRLNYLRKLTAIFQIISVDRRGLVLIKNLNNKAFLKPHTIKAQTIAVLTFTFSLTGTACVCSLHQHK